jgi:ribosomal protein L15
VDFTYSVGGKSREEGRLRRGIWRGVGGEIGRGERGGFALKSLSVRVRRQGKARQGKTKKQMLYPNPSPTARKRSNRPEIPNSPKCIKRFVEKKKERSERGWWIMCEMSVAGSRWVWV